MFFHECVDNKTAGVSRQAYFYWNWAGKCWVEKISGGLERSLLSVNENGLWPCRFLFLVHFYQFNSNLSHPHCIIRYWSSYRDQCFHVFLSVVQMTGGGGERKWESGERMWEWNTLIQACPGLVRSKSRHRFYREPRTIWEQKTLMWTQEMQRNWQGCIQGSTNHTHFASVSVR